jgi:hypothetical protein
MATNFFNGAREGSTEYSAWVRWLAARARGAARADQSAVFACFFRLPPTSTALREVSGDNCRCLMHGSADRALWGGRRV